MFWDPYDRYRREQQRRLAEQEAARRARAEAEQRRRAQAAEPPHRESSQEVLARFQEELAQARRERDEWADRYDQLMSSLEQQRELLEGERARLAEAAARVEAQRAELMGEARAEAEAQRERVQRNAEQRAFTETRNILQRLVEVADNMERALAQLPEDDPSPVAEGLRLTHREFHRALEQAGVERLVTVGERFDPSLHEAVASRPSGATPDTILDEVLPGYTYRGILLRPAKVVVSL